MRTYEKTHPWITFELNLRRLPHDVWVLLGEAQSKCDHLAGVPLRPETANELLQVYLAKGVLATTAIEGNTLSELEVRKAINGTLTLPKSKQYLKREVDNVLGLCNELVTEIQSGRPIALTPDKVCYWNRELLAGLAVEDGVQPGRTRQHEVGVGRYKGAPAADCEFLLGRLCETLNAAWLTEHELGHLVVPILGAIMAHLYVAWIHPFGDGNGRTARMLELAVLLQAGAPQPAAHLLSNHYNETRADYYRHLQQASESKDPYPFIKYAVTGFVDGLKAQIDAVRKQQLDVAWRNFVHERFRGARTDAHKRRRDLVLELSLADHPLSTTEILDRFPRLYTNRTTKTLSRDLNELLGDPVPLLERTGHAVRVRRELIEAFLPICSKKRGA